jgi:hypothetical protein
MARLSSQKPRGYVMPASSEEEDRSAARVAESLLEFVTEDIGLDPAMDLSDWWTCIAGASFLKVRFTEDIDPSTNQPGKLCVDVVRPFDLYVADLEETRIREQPWICHVQSLMTDDIKERFGVDVKADSSVSEVDSKIRNVMSIFSQSKGDDYALVKEMWIKPCAAFPKGLVCATANGKLLPYSELQPQDNMDVSPDDPDMMQDTVETSKPEGTIEWPYGHGKLPFVRRGHTLSGKFYDTSFIEQLISLQREYNRSRSQIIENKNITSRPQWTVPIGSVDRNQLTTEPGAIIEYTPGFNPPQPVQIPSMPNYVMEHIKVTGQEMDEIASQNAVSKGSVPPGVEAACVRNDSYAITRTGYKNHTKLRIGEDILAFVPETNSCEWQPVTDVFFSEFEGKLHVLDNRQISVRSTKHHRWCVGNRWAWDSRREAQYSMKRSEDLKRGDLIPLIRPLDNDNIEIHGYDFCKLLGVVATDGYISGDTGVYIYQSALAKLEHYLEIKRLLKVSGVKWSEGTQAAGNNIHKGHYIKASETQRFYLHGEVARKIRRLLPNKRPKYSFLSSLSQEELEGFIEGMLLGDGSISGDTRKLGTSYRKIAKLFQYACTLAGITASASRYDTDKYATGEWYEIRLKESERFGTWANAGYADKGYEEYKGIVWCPVVPSTYWVAYCNGKTFITGNTAIAYLQERDDSALAYGIRSRERAYQEVGQQLLSLITEFWDVGRMVRVVGQNDIFDSYVLKGSDLRGNTDYRVVVGSGTPISRAAQHAELLEMIKTGILPGAKGLKFLGMPDISQVIEEVERDIIQASKENLMMSRGQVPEVHVWHDHVAHLDEHDSFKKKEEYEHLNQQFKDIYRFHDFMHLQQLAMLFDMMPPQMVPPQVDPANPMAVDPVMEFELRKVLMRLKAGVGAPAPSQESAPA